MKIIKAIQEKRLTINDESFLYNKRLEKYPVNPNDIIIDIIDIIPPNIVFFPVSPSLLNVK